MHILVTRPEADAAALQVPLEAMGHRVSLAPMLEVSFNGAEPVDLDNCAGLIATSRNGLRGFEHQRPSFRPQALQLPLFAVGPGTAALARSLGFERVIEGPATAQDLVPVVSKSLKPSSGALVRLAGDNLAFDLKAALAPFGYGLRQPVVYRTAAATRLPADVEENVVLGRIDAVILMSPKTAQTFVAIVTDRGLAEAARKLSFICLSGAVAGSLAPWQPVRTAVASKPNLDEILLLVS